MTVDPDELQARLTDALECVQSLGRLAAAAELRARAAEKRLTDLRAAKSREPWKPHPEDDGAVTFGGAVSQALGAASMCREYVDGVAVFDPGTWQWVAEGLMAWLSDWSDEQRRLANEATIGKLRTVMQTELNMRGYIDRPFLKVHGLA